MNYKIYDDNIKKATYDDIAVEYNYSNTKKDFLNFKEFGNNRKEAEIFIKELQKKGYSKLNYNTNYNSITDTCYKN